MNKALFTLTLSFLSICACEDAMSGGTCDAGSVAPAPENYSTFIVYVADGSWDPADTSYVPPTLEELQRDSWGWGDAEIATFEADAKAFFNSRFGIDVDDPANEGRLTFVPVVLEPRARYRVVTMSDRDVPPEGWLLSDGSFQVVFQDPAGYELGGDLPGIVVPAGGFLTWGRYQIETGDEPIEIWFKSLSALVADATGLGSFRCELESEDYGAGISFGVFRQIQDTNGDIAFDIRNTLTFE